MTTRDRLMIMAAGLVVVLGAFWMLVLGPRRHEAADLSQQVTAARAQLAEVSKATATSATAERAQASDAAQLALLGQAVPNDDQTASLLYQLQDAAGRAHVVFNSIQPSGANGAPAGNATAAQPAPTSTTPTSTTAAPPADGASAPGASGGGTTPAAPGAAPGPAGVQQMALSLIFDGRYADLERFLERVHGFTTVHGQTIRVSGRLLSVQGIQLAAAPAGFPKIRATITATAYIAAPTQPAAPGTGAAGASSPATSAAAGAPAAGTAAPPTTSAMVGTP